MTPPTHPPIKPRTAPRLASGRTASSPSFTPQGVLPPGDHALTPQELRASVLVQGDGGASNWAKGWRGILVDNLEVLSDQLWRVGIEDIYIGGSFVTDKPCPNDIDGFFYCDPQEYREGSLAQRLKEISGEDLWFRHKRERYSTGFLFWRKVRSRRGKSLLWGRYRVEMIPFLAPYTPGRREPFVGSLDLQEYFRHPTQNKRRPTEGEVERGLVRLLRG